MTRLRTSGLMAAAILCGLSSQGLAFDLCRDRGDGLAQYMSGNWQMQTLGSRIYVDDMYRLQGDYGTETVRLDFAADGSGTISVKETSLVARLHDQGEFAIAGSDDHLKGLTAAFKETTKDDRAAVEGCDMRNVPQFTATADIDGAASHMEMVAMGADLFVGAQVVILVGEGELPDTRIITALLMRRNAGD